MELEIKPGVGLGPLLLGSDEHTVRELLGAPSQASDTKHSDGDVSHDLGYVDLSLSLSFSESDGFLLGSISTSNESSLFRGFNIVGMNESQLILCDFDGMGPPALDDDFEESGRDYWWDALNLSCWVLDGVVTSVTLIPSFDETGNTPLWPSAQS